MALLSDSLTLWEIAFRWEGLDPKRVWVRLPLVVRDHFRNLADAILSAEISCESITLEKRDFAPDEREFSVYFWIDDLYACIAGHHFNRKLLRHTLIGRYDLKLWCDRRNISLPDFWFPPGWNLEYELPEDEIHPGHYYVRKNWTQEEWAAYLESKSSDQSDGESTAPPFDPPSILLEESESAQSKENEASERRRPSQEAAAACRQIARALWEENPNRRISDVVNDELVQKFGGGKHYQFETVRTWIQKVAPPGVSANRGRPRKNPPGSNQ